MTAQKIEDGIHRGIQMAAVDITERRQTEEALREAKDHLEIRVKERTEELEHTNSALNEEVLERGRAESELEAERQRLHDVLERLPAYVILLTPDYHVSFGNRLFRERFGESHGRRCFEHLFGRSEPCENCETFKVLKTGALHRWEWTGPDGCNYDIYDLPFADSDGSPLIMEMGIDITERKRAEEALRAAEAYNRSLIEASLDPLVTIGPDGKISDVNAATELVTGYCFEDLIGTDFSGYFTDPESARAGYEKAFREGYVRDYPLEIQHRDGHVTPVLYNASVYRNDKGQVTGVFAAARDITAQRQASQYARSLIECSLDPLVTISADGKITDVNEATVNVTGVLKDQLIGTDFSSYFTEPEKARAGYRQVFDKSFITDYPLTIKHRDGGLTDVLYNASIYKDIEGNVLGVFAAARDITERRRAEVELDKYRRHLEDLVEERTHELEAANTQLKAEIIERKKAEEKIRHSEAQLKEAQRLSKVGNWEWCVESDIVTWSDELYDIAGLSPEKPAPNYKEHPNFYSKESWALFDKAAKNALDTGEPYELTLELLRVDGKHRWVNAHGEAVRDAQGCIVGLQGTVQDITERKRAEEALRETRDYLESLINYANAPIIVWDPGVNITQFNHAFEHLSGYAAEEVVGKKLVMLFPPGNIDESMDKIRGTLTGERWESVEIPILRKDGSVRIALWNSANIYGEQGVLQATIAQGQDITERKRAEEALCESEERSRQRAEELEKLMDMVPVGIWVAHDPQCHDITGNQAANELYEAELGENISATPASGEPIPHRRFFCNGRELKAEELPMQEAAAKGMDVYNSELEVLLPSGMRTTVWGNASPLLDAQGQVRGCIGAFVDITERKRAEEALSQSEANLAKAQELAHIGSWAMDPKTGGITRSAESYRIFGYAPDEGMIDFEDFLDHIVPEDRERVASTIRSMMKTGIPYNITYRIRRKDGGIRILTSAGEVAKDSSGHIIKIYGTNQDITEHMEAEREREQLVVRLQESIAKEEHQRSQLEAIFAAQNDAILIYDREMNVQKVNPSFLETYGFNPAGLNVRDIVQRVSCRWLDGRPFLWDEQPTPRALHGEKVADAYFTITKADGTDAAVEISSGPICGEDGITGTVTVWRDITKRIRAEKALQRSKDELEMRVRDRTAELLRAKDAAEVAARAKSEFLATMSHEIRTPMNAVLGMASILKETDLDCEQSECIETINSSGQALLDIIDDILDFTKMESGEMVLKRQPFHPKNCIEEASGLVASDASKKGLKLSCRMEGPVPEIVIGEPSRIRQVLVNLLANAVKFTEQGEVEVSLKAAQHHDNSYELHFEVRDTGIGISPECLGRLFKPFSQADSSNTRKHGGTGLGLAISKRLVELMGGKIWVESSPGLGSEFHFFISADAPDDLMKVVEPPLANSNTAKADQNKDLRILLAEDNPVNQRTAQLMLKKLGYKADAVSNGLEVLEALKQQPYDVILMDVQMPEMDGIEATRAIRQLWPLGPRIIALTAYALEGDREMCLEAGMDGYISKPMKKEELSLVLEKCSLEPQ